MWWIDPGNILLFVILPVFLLSATLGAPLMGEFGTSNFLSNDMVALGVAAICILAVGAKFGIAASARLNADGLIFDKRKFDQFIVWTLGVTLFAHVVLVGPLVSDPDLMIGVLTGDLGANFVAKDTMTRIPGLTSLTNLTPLLFAMCSIRFLNWGRFAPSPPALAAIFALLPLILIHAVIGSERIVLIENGLAFLLPLFSFTSSLRRAALIAPIFGISFLIVIFAFGEYTRSWPFYKEQYNSFFEFVGQRLLAYIAVAVNNGAGMITMLPPVGHPLMTARWMVQFPEIGLESPYYYDNYLERYGNVEFNNPSGVFSPIMDFGLTAGLLLLLLFGITLGVIYGLYRRLHPVGLLAYPIVFIGLADLTQIWYWGEPRFVPQLIFLAAAVALSVRRQLLPRLT